MVSVDLSFILMLIKEIVEDEVDLFIEGSISGLSINICYYQGSIVQVVDGSFCSCAGVFLKEIFLSTWAVFEFLIKQTSKTSKINCLYKYLCLDINNSNRQLSWRPAQYCIKMMNSI